MNKEQKICQNCHQEFWIEPEDFLFYEKIKVPAPTWCPACRFKRRVNTMNIYSLYKRTCDLCGKNVISIYRKESPFKVYCSSCWWGDTWDGTEFGQSYDPSRPFFEQFIELRNKTPFMALETQAITNINTDYTNYSSHNKNSYLTYFSDYAENCMYVSIMSNVKDSMDCSRIRESEGCYGSTGIFKCYRTFFSEECDSCIDTYFSKNCTGCANCFGCMNLRKKTYCVFNEQYTKDEYEKFLNRANLGSYASFQKHEAAAKEFWLKHPHRFYYGNAINVNVSGNYVYESKNAHDAYMITSAEDSRFVQMLSVPSTKDAYDYTGWGARANLIYECQSVGDGVSNVKFSLHCYPNVFNVEYCYYAVNAKNVFGCVNLKKKEYCILNKQYTKEEYESLRKRIIEDMTTHPYKDATGKIYPYGEFFPPTVTLFGYNKTLAIDYFPATKKQIIAEGFSWVDDEENQYTPTMQAVELPDAIEASKETITNEIIACASCKKSFRIINPEWELLKKFILPLPHTCPECRRKNRFSRTNSPQLWHRKCMKEGCHNKFETSYAPERSEIVYCESCYQKEVL